jgi:hypothetical protein
MWIVPALASLALMAIVLLDGFESILLPRRVTHPYRLTRLFYRAGWGCWRAISRRITHTRVRQTFLSWFGPLSLLGLFASWVIGLMLAFGLLHWSLATPIQGEHGPIGLSTYLYFSGATFFTLGYSDTTPDGWIGRVLAIAEAGLGFGFLAVVIGYLPVLFQAFSTREVTIALLDARAGSPPSAAELLRRLAHAESWAAVDPFLAEWERWAAGLLESHLSFPVLSFYRSQHDNQSWLAALTAMLDTCTLLMAGAKSCNTYQAQLTFAAARHAAVDLALVFKRPPRPPHPDRLSPERLERLREVLREAGLPLADGPAVDAKIAELRAMYEPFVNALALHLEFLLPPILADQAAVDNWQTSAWTRRTPGIGSLPVMRDGDAHFE